MKLRLQLLVESDAGEILATEEVAQLERHSLQPEDVGLTLAEAKQMLGSIQRLMVQKQVAEHIHEQSRCSECGQMLARRGNMRSYSARYLASCGSAVRASIRARVGKPAEPVSVLSPGTFRNEPRQNWSIWRPNSQRSCHMV
jgi:hypothetical protein